MKSSQKNRARLSIETLERRDAPATLTISPPGWVDPDPNPIVKEITASAKPGLANAELHSHGVVQWSPDGTEARAVESATAPAQARRFHLEESGAAVINPDGTISASASGDATHLGAFTLHDHSTIVGVDTTNGLVLQVVGHAHLEAANGDHLCASFTGSINLTAGTGTLNFEWTGGTGRFAHATGATVWQVSVNPDLTYSVVADGVIRY
jgi:hypothetical protein